MARLTALNQQTHGDIHVSPDRALGYAAPRYLMQLFVNEISQAVTDFPIFITRQSNGHPAISAMTSFDTGRNLFVKDNVWQSSFQPSLMQTYPFYLMKPDDGSDKPIIGLDASDPVFGKAGDPVFDSSGKQSLWVTQVMSRLMEDVRNMVHSAKFLERIFALKLNRQIDISVHYADEAVNRITNLITIDEDRLHELQAEPLSALRNDGYLAPIYAILLSIYQLNALIRRHNISSDRKILRINLEVAKDRHA